MNSLARRASGWTLTAGEVAALAGKPGWRLVDARSPERYRGEREPIDKKPGRIPGARESFLQVEPQRRATEHSDRRKRSAREFIASVSAVAPVDQIVSYCGSGVTACHNLLALEHAGLPGAKLYPGSWSEWSGDPSRPVEKS